MHCFLKAGSLGETRCKSWNPLKECDSLSLRYVRRVSRKRKDHRWERWKSKLTISEVPTLWNLRTGPRRDWTTAAMCPKQGMESCQKHFRDHKGYIPFSSGGMGTRGFVMKRAGGEVLCSWFRSECACGQHARLTLLSSRPWWHQEVRRWWWRPTARCIQEKKRQYVSKNWTYSRRLCFLKKLPQFFVGWNSGRTMVKLATGPEAHLTKNRQGSWLQHLQLCTICGSWIINEFSFMFILICLFTIFFTGVNISEHRKPEFGWWKEFRWHPEQRSQDTSKSSHGLPMKPRAKSGTGFG